MSTVFAGKLQRGDVIRGYEDQGTVTKVYRKGVQYIVETTSGTDLSMLLHERVKLGNR